MNTRKFRHVDGFADGTPYVEFNNAGEWRVGLPDRPWHPADDTEYGIGYSLNWAIDAVARGVWEEV